MNPWCHPTISSSVAHFSSCSQSFPASGSFPMNWLFTSDGQSIGGSASAPVLPRSIQGWFPFRLTGLILQSKGLSGVFSSTINYLVLCLLFHFPWGSAGKETTCNAGVLGSIPGLGRSPGEGKGYPLQYSDLENTMDCIVHGVTKSWTQLSDFHFYFLLYCPALVSIHDHCKDHNLDYTDLCWQSDVFTL